MRQRNDGIYFIPDTSSDDARVQGTSNGQRGCTVSGLRSRRKAGHGILYAPWPCVREGKNVYTFFQFQMLATDITNKAYLQIESTYLAGQKKLTVQLSRLRPCHFGGGRPILALETGQFYFALILRKQMPLLKKYHKKHMLKWGYCIEC